jgi:hypothetical protein
MEELTVQDFLSPSQSNKFVRYNVDDWDNSQIMKKFSEFSPIELIQLGPLTFNVVFRDDIQYDLIWEQLYHYVVGFTNYVCRNKLSTSYIGKNYVNKANLLVTCSIYNKEIYNEFGVDTLLGFFLCDYDQKTKAHIIATCYNDADKTKRGGGLLLRCIGLSILKNLGFKDIYTEAAYAKLVKYYDQMGFRVSDKMCGAKDDPLLEMYGKFTLDNIMDVAEDLTKHLPGWPLKWCDYNEKLICETAIQQIKKMKKSEASSSLLDDLRKQKMKFI